MLIDLRPVDSIRPYEKNPRVNDAAVDVVVWSLKEFGFRQPIVVDRNGVIIVGHTLWKAAFPAAAQKPAPSRNRNLA